MGNRNSEASRFARITKWNDLVAGLIGFLDNVRIWELAGEIPPQFYTFPTMLKVLSLSLSFSALVALIGNVFEIGRYFIGVNLTPVWYGIIFAFFYMRYYGSFGSFGINVYRTVISTTIITLFLMDNALKNFFAFLGQLLKYSDYPDLAQYLPSYGIQLYHFVYFAILFIPEKRRDLLEIKPLYSSKIVELTEDIYESLVEYESTKYEYETEGQEIGGVLTPAHDNSLGSKDRNDGADYMEKLKGMIKQRIDSGYEVFLWDKNIYVIRELVEKHGISTNGFKKVRILQNGKLKKEGEYLVLYASEIINKDLRKKVMKARQEDSEKREMFRNLKVEVVE